MKKHLNISLLLLFALIVNTAKASNPFTLKLKSGNIQIKAQGANTTIKNYLTENGSSYAIIQFHKIPSSSEKTRIEASGIKLLEYLPNFSFLAFIDQPANADFKSLNIRAIIPYLEMYKYSPSMEQKEAPEWSITEGGKIKLMIEPHLNVDQFEFTSLLEKNNYQIKSIDPSTSFYFIETKRGDIEKLAILESVKFIDYIPAPPEKEDDRGRSLHRGNLLDADHDLGRKYDGTGVSMAIADDGLIGPHIDYTGRVTQFVSFNTGSHGDMTSGIAMGAGNLDPSIRGAATGAYLYYYNITGYPHISNAVSNLNNRGVVITSTSYSEGCNAGYTSTTRTVDQQTRQNPELIHVFSAGNSSTSSCNQNAYGAGTPWGTITGGRKQGKSTMTVGNLTYTGSLTASSSRGPASDGRIKPDICSNGTNQQSTDPDNQYAPGGGTSAAAPGIAGLTAQLYHGYRSLNNGNNPESGLIKSVMLNTARDIGNVGPDYFYGWGRVNAHRAMKLLEENRYLDASISTDSSNSHSIVIPGDLLELRLMVYWTDYEASTISSQALVNDLDIQVIIPSGDTIRPWILDPTANPTTLNAPATRGVDTLNNMEQVVIDSATAGTYVVLVNGTSVPQGPQKYFLSWETKTNKIEVTYPIGGESFVPGERETIRWDAAASNDLFYVEYSIDSGLTWNSIGLSSGSLRYRDWVVPNNITGNALIKVSRSLGSTNFGETDSSDYPFSIIQTPNNIVADYICLDSMGIKWDKVAGATSYEISMLGSMYMDSIGRSDTNYFVMPIEITSSNVWVSVKALGSGITGRRANAIQIPLNIFNCEFNNDLSIEALISPNENYLFNCSSTDYEVSIVLKNNGNSTLSNVPLQYTINGLVFNDTLTNSLAEDSSTIFTFKDPISKNSSGTINLTIEANMAGDENYTNDSLVTSFDILTATTASLPHNNSFDSIGTCPTTNNCGGTTCPLNLGWINMSNAYDDFDMRINTGSTPSPNTGPQNDHTNDTLVGNYIYSEASNNCVEVESHVVSPCIDLSNKVKPELSFWYHTYGANIGSISVDVYSEGFWDTTVVTIIQGNNGDLWKKQEVSLSKYIGQTVNIRLRIKTGQTYLSDIAIDDILIEEESTKLNEARADDIAFKIYPNPASQQVKIEFDKTPYNRPLAIYDINGRIIKGFYVNAAKTSIDVSNLESGIYFLTIENSQIRKKLVIY